jgi:hypothetical protein
MTTNLEEIIAKERHRRERLNRQQRPYIHWVETGGQPPEHDVWCDYCQGFFGVPHTYTHSDEDGNYRPCRFVPRAMQGDRQCACVECMCAEQVYGEGSLASRITYS